MDSDSWTLPCVFAGSMAVGALVLIPYIHIGIFHLLFWVPWKHPVDRDNCSCNCWDTIYKGSYESQGRIGYKHIYFNATIQTYIIFVISVVSFTLAYESLKRLCQLIFHRKLRWSMLTLILLDIYPHYYSWWMYFNYINDAFYNQFRHATFFALTEVISTFLIFTMCSTDSVLDPRKVITILSISFVHLIVGGLDQFFVQLVLGQGRLFQKFRNLGFLLPDIIHIVLPLYILKKNNPASHIKGLFNVMDIRIAFIVTCFLILIGKCL